jgi:drug/metabolite transporter (DMT)-like permease
MHFPSGIYLGMSLAFCASVFWTVTPIFFAAAGRRIGAYNVNVLRLILAAVFMVAIVSVYALFRGGASIFIMPWKGYLWFTLSGLFGLVIGDIFYLLALTSLGPRRTTQFVTLAPVIPVIIAWIFLGERLSWQLCTGIALILAGIGYITNHESNPGNHEESAEPGKFSFKGFLIAAIGSVFHGTGAVMARQAFVAAPDVDPIVATSVRVVSAAIINCLIALCCGILFKSIKSIKSPGVMSRIVFAVLSGPVIGMFFYVSAFKYSYAGVVTTLSSLSPIMILPIIAFRYRVRIRKEAIIGTLIAIAGVAVMGLPK